MRIGIDMFGNQSPSRTRGIGRYVRSLVSNLLLRHPQHEYFLYHHPGQTGLDDLWPGRPVVRVIDSLSSSATLRDTAGRLVVDNLDRLDVYLVLNAMEYYASFLPPPKPLGGPKMAVVMHDLIPAFFQEQYLRHPEWMWAYERALRTVRQYDLLMTNSESTRTDCLGCLGVPPERVVTIGASSDGAFFVPDHRRPPGAAAASALRQLGVADPFVFYLSGNDPRKNHAGLIVAFGHLPGTLRETHQLVITCGLSGEIERELRGLATRHGVGHRLILTDYQPDEATRILYQQCAAFAFVSRYEGFGLPLLEALHCGAPVLAGRNSSQVEVVGEAGLLANVDDPHDLARQLERLLVDQPLAAALRLRGPVQAAGFRWEETADRAAAALASLAAPKALTIPPRAKMRAAAGRGKPRLAFFSPLPPQPSGIAEYAANLLAELRNHYTIDLYHGPGVMPLLCHASHEFGCRDWRVFPRYHQVLNYRRILYHMGNSGCHGFVYDTLLRFPGVAVLHDLFLANFHAWYAEQPGAPAGHFFEQVFASAGAWAEEYRRTGTEWVSEAGGLMGRCARRGITCSRGVLEAATTVVVHDQWNEAAIRRFHPDYRGRVQVVPHGVKVSEISLAERRARRSAYGLPPDALIFGCFGILGHTKCNLEAIEAFAALADAYPAAILLFVGRDLGEGVATAKVEEMGLAPRVRFLGHVPAEALLDLVAIADVGINLRRPPTNGETSGTLQLLLSAGTPTIVSDVDTFSSYPDRAVCKIAWGDDFTLRLAEAMRTLVVDSRRRHALGCAAVDFIRETRDWRLVARRYVEVVEDACRSQVPKRVA